MDDALFSDDAPLLEVSDLSVTFSSEDGLVRAVRGVSFTLEPGRLLSVVGESGSGKSVTAMALLGLLPRSAQVAGSAKFRGMELLGRPDREMMAVRGAEIAMIFQDPMTSLNPVYSVGWQLVEAIQAHQEIDKDAAWDRAVHLLDTVGIPEARQRAAGYPHEFSGGMRQRVVIAMAMANDPDVIIADEPTTALDVTVQAQVLEALRTAQEVTHAAIILITHDLGVVAGLADDVMVMYAGKAVERGTVEDIFYWPRMPYTKGLLGSLPRLDASGDERLRPIPGVPPSLANMPPGCPFMPRCPISRPNCAEDEPVLRPVVGGGHLAACHYAEEVSPGDELFAPISSDAEVVE